MLFGAPRPEAAIQAFAASACKVLEALDAAPNGIAAALRSMAGDTLPKPPAAPYPRDDEWPEPLPDGDDDADADADATTSGGAPESKSDAPAADEAGAPRSRLASDAQVAV